MNGRTTLILTLATLALAAVGVGTYFNQAQELQLAESSPWLEDSSDYSPGAILESSPNLVAAEEHPDDRVASLALGVSTDSTEGEDPQPHSSDGVENPSIITLSPEVDALPVARSAFLKKEYGVCASVLGQAAAAGDERFDVHYLLGLSLRYLGRFADSAEVLEHAVELEPKNLRAHVNLARAYLDQGQSGKAREILDAVMLPETKNSDAWNVLGRVELAQQDLQKATEAFTRAIELNPSNAYAFNNLGYVHIQMESWQAASEALEAAVQLKEDVAFFHNNLAVSYERMGQLDRALAEYKEAVRLRPDYDKALASMTRIEPLAMIYDAQHGVANVAGNTDTTSEDLTVLDGTTKSPGESPATKNDASDEDVAVRPK